MSTKEEKQREVEQRVREQLPPLDVGQFAGVSEPRPGEIERALRVAERVVFGATLKDAALIEGARWPFFDKALKRYRASERALEGDGERASDVIGESTWTWALGYTLDRAMAMCRVRWQLLAEAGGKGSSTALWMLERRGGRSYLPAVRREQVTTTATSTQTNVTLSLEASLADTQARLGFDESHLAQLGEWLSRSQTAAQRGEALPSPPTPTRELDVIDVTPRGGDE
jgi:hypothetical protein